MLQREKPALPTGPNSDVSGLDRPNACSSRLSRVLDVASLTGSHAWSTADSDPLLSLSLTMLALEPSGVVKADPSGVRAVFLTLKVRYFS